VLNRRIELNGLRADGTEFPVELAITAIPGEGHPVFTAYLRDITERKHGELAAAERIRYATLDAEIGFALAGKDSLQAMLQACAESLVRNLDAGFVRIWTLAEVDVLALQASAGLYGIDSHFDARYDRVPVGHGAIGSIAAMRKPHLTNDAAGDAGVPEPDWAKKEGMLAFAGYPLIVNDRLFGALALFARHRLGESALAAIASAARGIALGIERKEMEDRLRQFVAQLSEADRRKDEFLATLAHELRNPMAPIRNGLQLMRLAGAKPAAVEQARAMMERQLTQLVRLVDDLMDVSRITRGRLELRKEHVLLTTVVNSAIEASQAMIEERGHELTVSLPSQPITLDADPTRLTQVLLNLLGNAAKYSDPGGHIWLTAERQGRELMLSVRDAGIGIAAEHLPHIFELFAQVDRSLERSQSGLGIGLTLVKRLVEMHGGRVEAKSEGPGKGSEFVARLPIVVLSMGKPAAVRADPANPPSSLRILVVDDNCDGADSLTMMLRLVGNDVRTAYDGEQGVAEAESFRPDVVLLDIGLPKRDGYEACRLIRDQPWGRSLVAVAVTGWGQERDIRRSREAGFDHHMVKPVDPAALLQLLAELQVQKTEPPPPAP